MDSQSIYTSEKKNKRVSDPKAPAGAPVAPASFYGTQSQKPPPLPRRSSAALGSANTTVFITPPNEESFNPEFSPFREPELVPDDEPMPSAQKLTEGPDTGSQPFQMYETTPTANDANLNSWADATDQGPWSMHNEGRDFGANMWQTGTTIRRIDIDGRSEYEENNWWDPWVRENNLRPGAGILPPLLADRLHNPEHSLFSVIVTPPDIKPLAAAPSDSAAPAPAPQPTADEVRTAVPHPNAYYCRKHNGWVLLAWKSSAVPPPLARSWQEANPGVKLPDQVRRRRTHSCIADSQPFGPANRTHHFHVYERAVDARKVTPPFHRSEWQQGEKQKQRRRKMTLVLDELDPDVTVQEVPADDSAVDDVEEEGDLLDLYVCCQCSFYALASEVIPGVLPVKYLDELAKDKMESPNVGKTGESTAILALETILIIIENKLWKNENRLLPVSRKAFRAKLGWSPLMRKIFQALGFNVQPASENQTEDVNLLPPPTDLNSPASRLSRSKLLRAWVELSAWVTDFQKRFAPSLKDYVLHPTWIRIENVRETYQTAIGAHPDQIARGNLPTPLIGLEELGDAWTHLGMTPTTYSWELLAFAYYAQCRCDPVHTIEHFSAFYFIFDTMVRMGEMPPSELQDIVLEERSRDRFTHDNLHDAVKLFGFGKDGPLGVDFEDDVPNEFIENAWKEAVRRAWRDPSGDPQRMQEVNDSFRLIAEARQSSELYNKWKLAKDGGMTPERAFSTLEVPKDIDDSMLITVFTMRVIDQPTQTEKMREALSVIAEARDSERLRQFLSTGTDPADVVVPTRADWPRGLNQLGNTCYLNSLLQYFYTIKDLREAIEPLLDTAKKSLEDDKLTDDDLKRHRVGGRLVTRREIVRSKKFVAQLAELFHELEYNETAAVTPTIELAKLALVTSKDEEEEDADRNGTVSSNDTDATLVDDVPPRPITAPNSPSGSPGAGSSSSILGKRSRSPDTASEMAVDTQTDKENYDAVPSTIARAQSSRRAGVAESGTLWEEGATPSNEIAMGELPIGPAPPPLPPRKIPSSESTMMFGRQHDVSECMDNCVFQIETALLKFDNLGGAEEGKSSIVKRLFFGTLKQRITSVPYTEPSSPFPVHEKEDLFSLLPVNVSDEGYDLYDGLSGYFDDVVEFESKKARMEVTLVDLPPVLQIQLQRAQFDRETMQPYKSQAFVKFGETIYMDRFLDSANPEKKERSKAIHSELSACRDRIHQMTTGKHIPFGPSLANTHQFLKEQDVMSLPEVDDELLAGLLDEQDYLKTELEDLRARAAKLKEELEETWQTEHEAAYELTSVFIHRGSSPSWGHYFFYSRHLPENPDSWFKYNDSDVSVVPKDEVLADTTGSTANPYMLVYVRKGSDMINTVKRFDPMNIE